PVGVFRDNALGDKDGGFVGIVVDHHPGREVGLDLPFGIGHGNLHAEGTVVGIDEVAGLSDLGGNAVAQDRKVDLDILALGDIGQVALGHVHHDVHIGKVDDPENLGIGPWGHYGALILDHIVD